MTSQWKGYIPSYRPEYQYQPFEEGYTCAMNSETVRSAVASMHVALAAFLGLNGIVTEEIWKGNYEAVHALEDAIGAYEKDLTPEKEAP